MTAKVTATSGEQWHTINPPDKRGAYVDGHQRTHKAEPLALRVQDQAN